MYTRDAQNKVTLSEDTRGKLYYFPDYNRNDPHDPGNIAADTAPFLRSQTLEYTERTTETMQLKGQHKFPIPEVGFKGIFSFLAPELNLDPGPKFVWSQPAGQDAIRFPLARAFICPGRPALHDGFH